MPSGVFFAILVPFLGSAIVLAEESFLGEEKTLFRIDEVKVLGNRKVEVEAILEKINSYFFDIKDVPSAFISAISKNCRDVILKQVYKTYLKWKKSIKTSELNQWLHTDFLDTKVNKNSYISTKFRYITQTKSRPPTFSLYCNTKKNINLSKIRFFKNRLRRKFGLEGIPIRINVKISKNPYKK